MDYLDEEEFELPLVNVEYISDMIIFENANYVAEYLSQDNPEVATALLEELLYWREKGRI